MKNIEPQTMLNIIVVVIFLLMFSCCGGIFWISGIERDRIKEKANLALVVELEAVTAARKKTIVDIERVRHDQLIITFHDGTKLSITSTGHRGSKIIIR